MATGTRHRRSSKGKPTKKKVASTKQKPRPAGPTTLHDVPDHLLPLILLRLDSSASLLRAAAACKLWHRIIADTGFLTRFRALHAPWVVGHYHAFDPDWVEYDSPPITGNPVFVPTSSSSPHNNNAIDSRHFSLDFLPESDSGWAIADSCGSLLLLFKKSTRTGWSALYQSFSIPDLVVCDPLTRRCQGILSPDIGYCPGVFLLNGDDHHASGAHISLSNFRVATVLRDYCELEEPDEELFYKPVACVFSPGNDDGGWSFLPTASTNSDGVTLPAGSIESMTFAGRMNGSLYWVTGEDGFMIVLNEATMSFSRITFPAESGVATGCCDKWSFRVIGGEDGTLRVVRMVNSNLIIFKRQQHLDSDHDEWVVEKFLRLREAAGDLPGCEDHWYFQRNAMIVVAHDSYILVTPQEKTCLFSVELKTMQVVCNKERNRYPGLAYPCELPWPPALEACATGGRGRRRRCP